MLKNYSIQINESPLLFKDYLYRFNRVAKFFTWDPIHDWEQCIQERLANYKNRERVQSILFKQNQNWTAKDKTFSNIEKFGLPNTVAIATGQQVGLFGGPLYTIYKAMAVVKLTQHLQRQYPDWNFVPIFWMEVGDNDYREINHLSILNMSGKVISLTLPENSDDLRSICLRTIPEEIDLIHQKLIDTLPPSDSRDKILERYRKIYAAGKYFHDAFAEWLHYLLGDYGLVIINSTEANFGELNKIIFKRVIQRHNKIERELESLNRKLNDADYHNQIELAKGQTLLFSQLANKNRAKIEYRNSKFDMGSGENFMSLTEDELLEHIDKHPSQYTPNVALRPILQDFLLPIAAYIAGPGEISYAAQLKPLYEQLDIVEPIYYPRPRITLLENRIVRLIEKFGFSYENIFEHRENLAQHYVTEITNQHLEEILETSKMKIKDVFQEIKKIVTSIEPTLQSSVEKTTGNMEQILQKLINKANQAYERKMETEIQQLNKISINLLPNGHFQERVFNLVQYISKYGSDFIDEIYNIMDVENFSHQLLIIG